jgi:hypothetical protein
MNTVVCQYLRRVRSSSYPRGGKSVNAQVLYIKWRGSHTEPAHTRLYTTNHLSSTYHAYCNINAVKIVVMPTCSGDDRRKSLDKSSPDAVLFPNVSGLQLVGSVDEWTRDTKGWPYASTACYRTTCHCWISFIFSLKLPLKWTKAFFKKLPTQTLKNKGERPTLAGQEISPSFHEMEGRWQCRD